jgi:hypothetical protein
MLRSLIILRKIDIPSINTRKLIPMNNGPDYDLITQELKNLTNKEDRLGVPAKNDKEKVPRYL